MTVTTLINPYRFASSGPPTLSYTTDLALRLDAYVVASMTDAGSGACSAWADQSGNSNNAGGSTGSSRPTIGTDSTTGYGKLTFDGTDDWMSVADHSTLKPTAGISVFIACNINSWGTGYPSIVTKSNGGTWTTGYHAGSKSGSTAYVFINSQPVSLGATSGLTGRKLIALNYDSASITSDLIEARVSGSTINSTTYNSAITANTNAVVLGALQASASAGDYVGVDMFEVLIFSNGLSSTNRNTVESYLTTKWSL